MELILGYEILESYKRLPYKAWFAFAEFIDNSTQSYRNNKKKLDDWYQADSKMLTVQISYANNSKKKQDGFITIVDNAFGMNESDLQNAMILGKKPKIANERSKYGLGLKTAAFWFGNKWTIETTQRGSDKLLTVSIDLHKIIKEETEYYASHKGKKNVKQFRPILKIVKKDCPKEKHGTTLTITDLVRTISTQTSNATTEYLQSIYRVDLQNNKLYLEFQEKALSWSSENIDNRLLTDKKGNRFKRALNFKVNGKSVKGWAGILKPGEGSKAAGGFALLQADRVIVGYPKNYRNPLIFGPEDGGRNDLTNQRLTGELKLDEKFGVSHTKDQILFEDDEEDQLDNALFERLADYKKESNIPHKSRDGKTPENNFDFESAIKEVLETLRSDSFTDVILRKSVLPQKALAKTNEETIKRLLKARHKEFTYMIDGIAILVILSDESSPWDPYLIVRPLGGERKVTVVINVNHPYWMELADNNSRFNFLQNCIYDGVAEWKAGFIVKRLDPDTIKSIKDSLLRIELKSIS